MLLKSLPNSGDEGSGIKLGSEDLVGAVGKDGNSPVADEGDQLAVAHGFNLGAEALGGGNRFFTFNIEQNQVGWVGAEEFESRSVLTGGLDGVAGEAQDLVAERP